MFGSLGFPELIFIFVIALIIFGPRKLPELGKTLGQAIGQFKRASEDFKRSWEDEVDMEKKRMVEPVRPAPGTLARGAEAEPSVTVEDAEKPDKLSHATLPSVQEVATDHEKRTADSAV